MKRREFFTLSVGGVLIYTLNRQALWLNAAEAPVQVPLKSLSVQSSQRPDVTTMLEARSLNPVPPMLGV